ncbi:MAG: GAF domain-containing sensor histidine kinase, partial [Anaerolineae bacterium]|nr:GAF domain-containing sensor histidine kinase [Anaerolineae bacterium]
FSAAGGLPRWVRRLLSAGRSAAVTFVPLIFEGGVLGHLGLLSRAPLEAPDPEREGAVATFARLAAAALARAEHCRAMEQGAAESTLLLQIGQLLSATFDPDIMARILTDEARDLLEGDLAAFYLYEPVTDTMQLRALRGVSRERVEAAGLQRISLDCLPATRRAGASGQPVASQWPEDGDLIALFGPALRVRTSLTVPLRARGLPLGFLFVGRSARRPFDLAEAQLGFKLGALGALTLDNAQLYAGQSEQMKQLRAAQAQLIEAEKMASLGRIVAGVAHELNNPLAIISGYAQMLLADDVPPALRDGLERIDRGARRAAQVVRELLAFARQQPIAPTEIQVASLVREVLDRAEPAITTAGVEVELRIEDGLPPILGDRLQLARVLGELVEGALRAIASRPGAGKLTISATYRDGVSLAISDDGPGIAPGMLDKVFEPFATPGDSGPGSGLGLSMCYGVVRAHGGRISVANNRGPGATFYVELPAAGGG